MAIPRPWEGAFPPFKIFGNLYFTGTVPASTHIVDTGEGLIMFDSGYQQSLYLVIDGMYKLGLNPMDIKYIILTHGHIDHIGATRALVEMTGAKTALGKEDREYANGTLDLTWAKELDMEYTEFFEPDILLSDGDTLTLGNTTVTAMATPGHTPGAMSYFFDVTDGEKTYRAALHGGMGVNSMQKWFLDKYSLSYDCWDNFKNAMDRLSKEKADIFLGNHMQHNNTPENYEILKNTGENKFINPNAWGEYCLWAKQNLINSLKEEAK